MSKEPRGPNEKLGTLLALAGISNAGLARRVNDADAEPDVTIVNVSSVEYHARQLLRIICDGKWNE